MAKEEKLTDLSVEVGNRLRMIRLMNYMSMRDLAKLTGIGLSTVAAYEYGDRLPSASFIMLVCDMFNVNEEWLLHGKDTRQNISTTPVYRKKPIKCHVRVQKAEVIRAAIRNSKAAIKAKFSVRKR